MRSGRSSGRGATRLRAPWMTSVDDAVLAEMQLGELTVRIRHFVSDRPGGLGPATADLGLLELEAAHLLDAHAMLGAGHGIEDGLATLLDVARHLEVRAALVDIHGEIDVGK